MGRLGSCNKMAGCQRLRSLPFPIVVLLVTQAVADLPADCRHEAVLGAWTLRRHPAKTENRLSSCGVSYLGPQYRQERVPSSLGDLRGLIHPLGPQSQMETLAITLAEPNIILDP